MARTSADGLEPGRDRPHRRTGVGRKGMGLVRMHPGREPHRRPGRGEGPAPGPLGVVLGGEDHQGPLQPGLPGAGDHGVAVGDELLAGEVAVTIDHGGWGLGAGG